MNYLNKRKNKHQQANSEMAYKLAKIKKSLNDKRPKALSRAVTSWEGDGIDHININSSGVTDIGKFLSHNNSYSFVHPLLGRFASSRSFWLWLNTVERDDRIRNKIGSAAFSIYRQCRYRSIPNGRAVMLYADYQKLLQYPEAMETFKNSDLPLDNYFYDNDSEIKLPRRPSNFNWLIEGWEEIRLSLKEDREPDFTKWIDVKGSDIHDFVFNNDGSLPEIINRKETTVNHKHSTSFKAKPHHVVSVDVSHNNDTVDLEKDPVLKNEVHTVTIEEPVPVEETACSDEATEIVHASIPLEVEVSIEEDSSKLEESPIEENTPASSVMLDSLVKAYSK